MVRRLLPVLCMGCSTWIGGPADPAACGEAECGPVCAEAEAAIVVPEGGARLTAYEAERLSDGRTALTRGLGPRLSWPLLLCTGTSTCEQVIDLEYMHDLPPGAYVVALPLRVPEVGAWSVGAEVTCTAGGPASRQDVVPVRVNDGDLHADAVVPLSVPAPWAGSCDVKVSVPDGAYYAAIHLAFSETPAPLRFMDPEKLRVQPPATAAPSSQPMAPPVVEPGPP